MRITKCDVCKKKIDTEPLTAGLGWFPKAELCKKCGAPILALLKRYKFVSSKKIKGVKS